MKTDYLAGSAISQIQATFDSLHTLGKTVVSRMLVDHVAVMVGVIAPKTRNGHFQAGESLLDLAHNSLDATDIGADHPQMFENHFLRGIIPLLGFRSAIVYYGRSERFAGKPKYSGYIGSVFR